MRARVRPPAAFLLALFLVGLAACRAPRAPREKAGEKLTGRWTAESAAVGAPLDSGHVTWTLALEEQAGGKVGGRGSRTHGGRADAFAIDGLRGESELTLEFELRGQGVKYHGSILDARTLVGELQTPRDTLPVSFVRE
ncbi:MAG TPA: hypothetical protein VF615_02635 [Longimicrobiaceae bacterium]|jgi:hypothetical protein